MTFLEFAPIFVYRFVVVLFGFAGISLFPFGCSTVSFSKVILSRR